MASVRIDNLIKKYGDVEAVKGISLDIADGEFMAFLGPSGSGKSSTMRMIAGLEGITSGAIFYDGKNVSHVRPRDRNVAMAFETYALYTTLSVYENLAFPLRAAKWSEKKLDQRVREIAHIMGITALLERNTRQLSSGQQQSVGLARALIRTPSVFLLDEPISHLDTYQRTQMRAYLKSLHLELGYTMIYVTHDQEEAMALSDRIAVMSDGIINQVGTPSEIYSHPADLFVAGFIGEPPINFMSCEYLQDGNRDGLRHQGLTFDLPPHYRQLAQQNAIPRHLTLAIRPFNIDVAKARSDDHTIAAKVFVVEPLGDMTVITVELEKTRLQVVTASDVTVSPKQRLWLSLNPDYMLLFDANTSKSIDVSSTY